MEFCGQQPTTKPTTNDRLIALENRMNMFPLEVRVESDSPKENFQSLNVKPTTGSVELLIKKIQTSITRRIDFTAGRNRRPAVKHSIVKCKGMKLRVIMVHSILSSLRLMYYTHSLACKAIIKNDVNSIASWP